MATAQATPIPSPKTAVITGASSGIGADLARVFAEEGYHLVLVARSEAKMRALGEELRKAHGVAFDVIGADLAKPGAPAEVMATVAGLGLAVDVLVNNAGYGTYGKFVETSAEEELAMIQVNVVALTHLTKLVLPQMVARGSGRILNVASTAAFQPGPLMAVYYATKAYVLSFSEALANELGGTGVTLTTLCPGPTKTGFQRVAKMEKSRLVSTPSVVMDSMAVARAGYRGLIRGKTVVIPGAQNAVLASVVRFFPRRAVTRMVRTMQSPRPS